MQSNACECTIVDDAISDEEKAPVPVAEPVTQVVAQTPIVLPGPHGGDEENVESGDEGYSSVESVEENNETGMSYNAIQCVCCIFMIPYTDYS